MVQWLPELCALPLLPWLIAQGKQVRRITPRLPEAAGERDGVCMPAYAAAQKKPLHLFAIGESPVAGVGVELQEDAITAQFARQLSDFTNQTIHWYAFGKNGATVADALHDVIPLMQALPEPEAQVVLLAFGVNDATAFHSSRRYRRDLDMLIAAVQDSLKPDLLIVAGVPPLHLFPALPQPLRHVLGIKARALDLVTQQVVKLIPGAIYVPMQNNVCDFKLMARDGYHPSAAGVLVWARQLMQATAAKFVDVPAG